MALSGEEKSRAAAIVDRWFWQIDESRQYRFAGATKRIVRFYESAPLSADVFALVLEYLRSMENVSEISLNHKNVQLEGRWNAIGAWYATAQGAQWAGTESAKVRVYQALGAASELSAGDVYVVENGCKYKVSHTFFWDVDAAPTVPTGTSGVQYSVQGLSRDKETGLYSYVVEKRETVQQDIELYESAKTIFETRSEEVHHGVKDSAVASTGAAASAGGGKLVERRITKNPDCTSDVQIVEREEVGVCKSRRTVRTTPFRTVVTFRDTAAEEFTGEAPKDFPVDQVTAHSAESPAADGAGTAREVSIEATPGGLQTSEKVYIYPKAVSWSTPELSTSFRFKRTWFYRNFSEEQVKKLCDEVAKYLKGKVNGWIEDRRPPLNHDVDPQMTLNDDGFYDGAVAIVASWAEDSAGLDGNTDYVLSDITYSFWAFNYKSDRSYKTDQTGGSVFEGFIGMRVTKRRISGYGLTMLKNLLNVGKTHPFAGYEPQIALNSKTHAWTVEMVMGVECGNGLDPEKFIPASEVNPTWVGTAVDEVVEEYKNRFSASESTVTEPNTDATDFS